MRTVRTVSEMQTLALGFRAEHRRIGLVPTMGFLHAGHLSLIRLARERADVVVVSLFVNSLQFGPAEDFSEYPRDLVRDEEMCREEKADVLFCPELIDMYAPGHSTYVEETELSNGLCGATRAGHFKGVTTVVAKLFHIVQPHVAVFGQKDAQQASVIEKMVKDLNFPVEIVRGPTIREPDGLAMSSRNKYLFGAERKDALCLHEALRRAEALCRAGVREPHRIRQAMVERIRQTSTAILDYIEIVDGPTFAPVSVVREGTLIAIAVRIGRTRLIDNLIIGSAV